MELLHQKYKNTQELTISELSCCNSQQHTRHCWDLQLFHKEKKINLQQNPSTQSCLRTLHLCQKLIHDDYQFHTQGSSHTNQQQVQKGFSGNHYQTGPHMHRQV